MKLVDYLSLARERIVVVLVVVAVSVATVVGLSLTQDARYEATVRLRARPAVPGSAASDILAEREEQTDLGTEAELVRSTAVAVAVAEEIDFAGDPDDLLDDVDVVVIPDTAVLLIVGRSAEPEHATSLTNAFAEQYLVIRRQVVTEALDEEATRQSARVRELIDRLTEIDQFLEGQDPESAAAAAAQAERAQVLTDLISARSRLDAVSDRAALAAGFGEIIQPASDANEIRATSLPRAVVFGLLLGIPLSLAVVLLLDTLSNAIRSRDDAERATGADVIGVVPLDPRWTDPAIARLSTVTDPFSSTSEAYRALGFTLARAMAQAGCSSVLVTSASGGDGKTATVANLAVSEADGGRACRAVDADLRNGRLHAFFGVEQRPGVADVLAGERSLDGTVVNVAPFLDVVPAGRPTERPDLLLSRTDVGSIIRGLLENVGGDGKASARPLRASGGRPPLRAPSGRSNGEGDPAPIVLVDSAPILEAAEVSRLAASVDAVLLVARVRVTSKQALAAAAEQVRRAGGSIVGVVLIGGTRAQAPSVETDGSGSPALARAAVTGDG